MVLENCNTATNVALQKNFEKRAQGRLSVDSPTLTNQIS